jgi:hypothetical protein
MPDMDVSQLDVNAIAQRLNERARTHPVGELQTIRAELKGLARRPGTNIFSAQTTHEDWAFHHGGRSELQFNIGTEHAFGRIELRHGVAFSFQLSQALPSIDELYPKVRLFDDYLRGHPEAFADMRMWHHREHESPSSEYPPGPIMPELVTPGPFVFLGKRQAGDNIDYETILNDFDRLLPLFIYIESSGREESSNAPAEESFHFRAGFTDKSPATNVTLAERELNIYLKHNILQAALCRRLISEYGSHNVRDEHPTTLGTKIDVVVRRSENEFWYYEIKTALSPRACLREAFGQLMEYAYWPGAHEAKRLIVCGESPLDGDGETYLRQLKNRFTLPIDYEQIILPDGRVP